jgi:hypothetical protein
MHHAMLNYFESLDERSMWVVRSLIHKRNEVHRGYNLTAILVAQILFALCATSYLKDNSVYALVFYALQQT